MEQLAPLEILVADDPEVFDDFRVMLAEDFAHLASYWPDPSPSRWQGECDGLPGEYARPSGRMLVAYVFGMAAGIVALKDLGGGMAEVKRLFVRPEFRRSGVARALMERLLAEARDAGYATARLGTAAIFTPALALYDSLGFRRIEPYREGAPFGAIFYELDLAEQGGESDATG